MIIMLTFNTDTTIKREGELHLDHIPFHVGDKVKVILIAPNGDDESAVREADYDAFMKGYTQEDSVYDKL
jgi:hypothetical protein